ncbi:MAG TPA: 2-oxoacid:acceptor oxidoreductase family protein [Candidatus Avidesulfovibrio excrementigallinarum]|nr:2-oxoacid:acceptor oxidoreductase family protein [Candidatus Avidesulfovibrio excrementigallinarum]
MEKYRFLLSGSGGQGVITMAILLAEAAVLYEGRVAVQSQSYGPEARGGATRSDVIIADEPILFPKVAQPNVLVTLTNEAAGKYMPLIRPGGMCLYDSDLVQPSRRIDAILHGIPMHRAVMEKFGKAQALNICVLGALVTLTGAVHMEAVEKVLAARFKPAFHAANSAALALGAELAKPFVDKNI